MNAVTNSGPLIVLAKLDCLSLLPRLYKTVLVPQAVYHETVVVGQRRLYPDAVVLRTFLKGQGWNPTPIHEFPAFLGANIALGSGEREVLALAWRKDCVALLDEIQARAVAREAGIATVGSLGILITAYRQGALVAGELDELLAIIERREDIWIHPGLCAQVRHQLLPR